MSAIEETTDRRSPSAGVLARRTAAVALAGAAALVILVYGGYGHHWRWTGINGKSATLWDWLHLLLLPLAAGILPIAVRRRDQLQTGHKAVGLAALSAFAVLVLVGYASPWEWTGFPGNKLWDWLELLALPLAIALIPVALELHVEWDRRSRLTVLCGLSVLIAFVAAAYLEDWGWTGFRGNTLWDWLHLLLLPLLVPAVAVPALRRATDARLPDPQDPVHASEPHTVQGNRPDQPTAVSGPPAGS